MSESDWWMWLAELCDAARPVSTESSAWGFGPNLSQSCLGLCEALKTLVPEEFRVRMAARITQYRNDMNVGYHWPLTQQGCRERAVFCRLQAELANEELCKKELSHV